jgi:hypothetical protein
LPPTTNELRKAGREAALTLLGLEGTFFRCFLNDHPMTVVIYAHRPQGATTAKDPEIKPRGLGLRRQGRKGGTDHRHRRRQQPPRAEDRAARVRQMSDDSPPTPHTVGMAPAFPLAIGASRASRRLRTTTVASPMA